MDVAYGGERSCSPCMHACVRECVLASIVVKGMCVKYHCLLSTLGTSSFLQRHYRSRCPCRVLATGGSPCTRSGRWRAISMCIRGGQYSYLQRVKTRAATFAGWLSFASRLLRVLAVSSWNGCEKRAENQHRSYHRGHFSPRFPFHFRSTLLTTQINNMCT